MKLKTILITCLFGMLAISAQAQSAMKILDTAAANFQKTKGVKITYAFSSGGEHGNGTIKLSGQKFVNDMGDMAVWFNGKTMWTLVKSNEEVNVTTPTAKEIAKMNPYAFMSLYKKGYKATMGKSSATFHEVLLTATDAKASLQNITVRIDKKTNQLQYVKMNGQGAQIEISVKSYTAQSFNDATFTFNAKNYPDVDVIDLR